MSQIEKLKIRLLQMPKDFTYKEAKTLLESIGFEEVQKGKTSGSRRMFYRKADERAILLHKPHPGAELKSYAVKYLVSYLKELGEL